MDDSQRKELVDEGRVFFLMTLSMHSTKWDPSQAAPLIIHELITSEEPGNQAISLIIPYT
jgi:hypothetical protein